MAATFDLKMLTPLAVARRDDGAVPRTITVDGRKCGVITSTALPMRQIQLGVKYSF